MHTWPTAAESNVSDWSPEREPGLLEGSPTVVRSCPGEQLLAHRQSRLLVGKFDERVTIDNFDGETWQHKSRTDLRPSVGLVSPEMQGTGKHPIAHQTPGERRVLMQTTIRVHAYSVTDADYDTSIIADRNTGGLGDVDDSTKRNSQLRPPR